MGRLGSARRNRAGGESVGRACRVGSEHSDGGENAGRGMARPPRGKASPPSLRESSQCPGSLVMLFKNKTEVLVLDSFLIQEAYDVDRRAEKGS